VERLRGQIKDLRKEQEETKESYIGLKTAVPLLHFMSMTIFPDDQYDPILVIEVNFDGPPGPFWSQFEAAFGERLRAMLRCGKVPRDGRAALFRSVTRDGSRAPIAPLLEALTIPPAVGHQGNRGLDRSRIEGEGALFAAVQAQLDAPRSQPWTNQQAIHGALRTALLPRFAWLGAAPVPRIEATENRLDWLRLIAFLCAVLVAVFLPGIIVSLVLPPIATFVVLIAAGFVLMRRLGFSSGLSSNLRSIGSTLGGLAVFAAIGAAVSALFGSIHHWHIERFGDHFATAGLHWALGLVGLLPTIAGLLVWIRWLEIRDPPQDSPPRDEAVLRAMARREDFIAQNHMGSVVHLKTGVLRAVLVRVALLGLGLILRIVARNGYLGSMRTIHFAHWVLISNGGRLLFFSNFDGSWESYLDDFIEKAHGGLTLAWTSGIGFPPTRFLVLDGATQGRKFKAWARHSMAESLFWFSAYRDYTVNQIERQARIADGLRRPTLSEKEAEAWALDL
jgi:hypothetical protein